LLKILKGNVAIMTISWVLFGIGTAITMPYYSLYIKALGGTDFHVALVISMSRLADIPLIIPGGYLTDIIGRRKLIIPLTWIVAILLFIYGLAPNWQYLLIISFIDSLLHFYRPALHAILVDSLPPKFRARGILISTLIPNIPWLIMPPLGGWLIDRYGLLGFRLAYIIAGITGVIAAILRTKFLVETLPAERRIKTINKRNILSSYLDTIKVIKEVRKEVKYMIIGSMLISGITVSTYASYAVIFTSEIIGLSKELWGWFNTIGMVIAIIISLLLIPYLDKASRRIVIVASSLIYVLGISSILTLNYIGVLISVILTSIAYTIYHPAWQAYIGDIVKKELRGRINAIITIATAFGLFWGNLFVGYIYSINPVLTFEIGVIIGFIEVTYWAITIREPKVRQV